MVLVDSSVWIESIRRKGDLAAKAALRALMEEYQACFCGMVKLEVLGAASGEQKRRLSTLFSVIPYLSMKDEQWNQAMRLSWQLRRKGVCVPFSDILIASIALDRQCRVYAIDKHFNEIRSASGLALYEPGYGGSYNPG